MKKRIVLFGVLFCLLIGVTFAAGAFAGLFAAEEPHPEMSSVPQHTEALAGSYVLSEAPGPESARWTHTAFTLQKDGTFTFIFSLISNYIGFGRYRMQGDTLSLKTGDGLYTYVFQKKGDAFIFDAKQSSDTLWFSEMQDGSVFQPVTEKNEDEVPLAQMGIALCIDRATLDIDGDGIEEDCMITPGPTSGLFTATITAAADGVVKYKNTFNLCHDIAFGEQSGEPQVLLGGEPKRLYVEENRIVIDGLDPEYEGYWGGAEWNMGI